MASSGLTGDDLPAVVMPGATLRRTTPGELAEKLNLRYPRPAVEPVDVAIVGGGWAGLTAAIHCASEGLRTVLLDAAGAGSSSLADAAAARPEPYTPPECAFREIRNLQPIAPLQSGSAARGQASVLTRHLAPAAAVTTWPKNDDD
jgi:thioredoxin reductase (NADPH)